MDRTSPAPPVDRHRLEQHVRLLAKRPRALGSEWLEETRAYCAGLLEEAGWIVRRHPFRLAVEGVTLDGVNLIASQRDRPVANGPRFVLGAHLDSRPETPGADDNASAVAVLLEIARLLPACWPESPALELELVVFDLEECGMLGGGEHARLMREGGVDLRGMASLEMLGYCDHRPGSQSLPRTLEGLYPHTGNFIAVIGNERSQPLIAKFRAGLERAEGLPVESLAVPGNGEWLQATRLSDHSPFWDAGYRALMITDTSFMRNPHYHLPSDTPDTLDWEFLHRVGQGCLQAVRGIVAEGIAE
jgi:aminopeptidase YwaD